MVDAVSFFSSAGFPGAKSPDDPTSVEGINVLLGYWSVGTENIEGCYYWSSGFKLWPEKRDVVACAGGVVAPGNNEFSAYGA